MVENLVNPPCILDPSKDCPTSCKLHDRAMNILSNQAIILQTTPAKAAEIIREGHKRMTIKQRAQDLTDQLSLLSQLNLLEECKRYEISKTD